MHVPVALVVGLLPSACDGADTRTIDVGSRPAAVAVGDVTGDDRRDVVMTTNNDYSPPGEDFRVWVFEQESDGALSEPVSYATAGSFSHELDSVAIGDLTGDGRNDVVLGVEEVGAQVFPQLSSGVLGTPTLSETADGRQVRVGQLDGDGRLDVAGIGFGTETVSVLLNDGERGLGAAMEFAAPHGGRDDLEVDDVTGDGRDDLVVMSGQFYGVPNITVLAQLPGGGFGSPSEYNVGGQTLTQGLGVGDVTGDRRNDVVVTHGGNTPSGRVAVFAQTTSGTLAAPVNYPSYDLPGPVEVSDVDGDGLGDVVVLHDGWERVGIYLQQRDGVLGEEDLHTIPSGGGYEPHGLAVGDFSGDDMPDIAIADAELGLIVRYTDP